MMVSPKCGTRSCVVYYVLISIAYLQISHFLSSATVNKSVCETSECHKLAEYYKEINNKYQRPCDDFYEHVCGNWGTYYGRPKYTKWTVQNQLELTVMSNIKKLLEEKREPHTKDEASAKSLYAWCMNLPTLERISTERLKNITQIVGNWPMFSSDTPNVKQHVWEHVHTEYLKISGESALFSHFLRAKTLGKNLIISPVMDAINSPYGTLKRYTNWDDKDELQSYKLFLYSLIYAVAPNKLKNQHEIEADVDDVIEFREKLRHVHHISANQQYRTITIGRFQAWYDAVSPNRDTAKIDWLSVIRAIYNNSRDAEGKLIDSTSFIVVQVEYFISLSEILAKTKDSVIANHIHLYFAERHVHLTSDIILNLKKSVSNFHRRTGSITLTPETRTECAMNKEMETILGRMYLKSDFSHSNQSAVSDMILLANSVLQKQILESQWVASSLKTRWIESYSHLDTQIGYPKWYFNKFIYTAHSTEDINPVKAEMHYSINHNRIGVSAAYLQWPIYDANLPPAVQYGALLTAIGRELYSGFNYTGLDAHLFGFRYNKLPLERYKEQYNMSQEFQKRAECFTDIYNKFKLGKTAPQFMKTPDFPLIVNEVIPDMMGLKLAYRAYKDEFPVLIHPAAGTAWQKIKSFFKSEEDREIGNCTVLPGLESYSCDQLFFVAYASSMCENSSPISEANVYPDDDQNPTSIRVNLAVSNMPEFRKAFNCPASLFEKKGACDLWK